MTTIGMQSRDTPRTARRAGASLAMLVAASLAGCGKKELPQTPPPPAAGSAASSGPVIEPQPGLSVKDRLARAVTLLTASDEATARAELGALLRQSPGNREAQVLRQSLDADFRSVLPRDSFAYVVRSGDSFITLALEYLGDSYKFYALARLNGVAANAIKPGDIVQIPGRFREPRRARRDPRRTASPVARPSTGGSRPSAVATPVPATPQNDPAGARRMRRAGLESMSAGRIDQAVARLSRAAQLDPADAAIAADLSRARRIQATVRGRN